jgi:hypothetical protein
MFWVSYSRQIADTVLQQQKGVDDDRDNGRLAEVV